MFGKCRCNGKTRPFAPALNRALPKLHLTDEPSVRLPVRISCLQDFRNLTVSSDNAFIAGNPACQYPQQGGFACAIAADEANPFPVLNFQLFNIQYDLYAVLFLNVLCI